MIASEASIGPKPVMVMCASKSRIFSRHMSSNPFITESTITSTATPSSTPRREITVTIEK